MINKFWYTIFLVLFIIFTIIFWPFTVFPCNFDSPQLKRNLLSNIIKHLHELRKALMINLKVAFHLLKIPRRQEQGLKNYMHAKAFECTQKKKFKIPLIPKIRERYFTEIFYSYFILFICSLLRYRRYVCSLFCHFCV